MKHLQVPILFQLILFCISSAITAQEMPEESGRVPEFYTNENSDDEVESSTQTASIQDRLTTRTTLKESQFVFNEALLNYEQGSKTRSKPLFHEALRLLSTANITPDQFFTLRNELNTIYIKLDGQYKDLVRKSPQQNGKYVIPMDSDNELVKRYLKLYTEGAPKENIRKALERSGRYANMIPPILQEYNLPRELVYLPVVESLYKINVLSSAGALGLWQIMPARAKALGLKVNYWIDERKDPEKSTRAAARYLQQLYAMFDDWHLALAAYNRGENGLTRDMTFSKATNIVDFSRRSAVPRETQRYVPQFIACTLIGDNFKDYGFDVNFDKPLAYDDVVIDKVIDLEVVAKCVNAELGMIRELNPALKTWCTPPNYENFVLHLPAGSKELFLTNIAKVNDLNPSRGFVKYKVVKGDYLGKIAKQFQTSAKAIQEDNKIKDARMLRIGHVLIIRPGRTYLK